jgi:hypothetical protein
MIEALDAALAHCLKLLLERCKFVTGEGNVVFGSAAHIRLLFAIAIVTSPAS